MRCSAGFSCPGRKEGLFTCIICLQGGSVGLEHFEGVVSAAASAMRSPLDEELSVGATWTLQSVAKRLAEAPQSVSLSFYRRPACLCLLWRLS